jgi:dihydropteroate synthase
MTSPWPTTGPQGSESGRSHAALSGRVIRWPAPASADGVYAVKISGPGRNGAGMADALARLGVPAVSHHGEVVIEGRVSRFALGAREDADLEAPVRAALKVAVRALDRFRHAPRLLPACSRTLDLRRPLVVGILNATPDSFYDRGRYFDRDAAIARAREMVAEGADLIEVGGETARPGPQVDPDEEVRRVVPLVEVLAGCLPVPVSVDTYKPEVAQRAVAAGAVLINDISGLEDVRMAEIAATTGAALVVMHIRGRPKVRQMAPQYRSVVDDVYAFLEARAAAAEAAGVARARLVIDPGFSFGKAAHHDVEVLRRLGEFRSLGCPIYLATSRKNYIRDLMGLPFEELLEGTAAAVAYGVAQGAHLVRTHDVQFMARVVRMMHAIVHPGAIEDGNRPREAAEGERRGQD